MRTLIIFISAIFILTSSKIFSQGWTQTGATPEGAGVTDMVVMDNGTLIVTTASYNWPSGQQGGIRRSTDEGNTWQNVLSAYNGRTLYLGTSGKLFASCWLFPENEGMFFSTNGGLNWQQTYFGSANDNVFSIAAKNGDSMVFIGTRNGVFRQYNNGTWLQINFGLPANSWVRDLSISPEGYILAATTNGVFRSTNQGNAWIPSGNGLPSGDTIISLSKFSAKGDVYCASSSGKAYKTNSGFAWTQMFSQRDEHISKIEISDEVLIDIFMIMIGNLIEAAIDDINYSFDEGQTWRGCYLIPNVSSPVSSFGFEVTSDKSVKTYAGQFLNAAGGAKIYKTLINVNVGVNQISSVVPNTFSLSQNYPNPFNPVTKIKFDISSDVKLEKSNVKLSIYDALGREVQVIVNQELSAGSYEAEWDASNQNSGIYFYKFVAGNFTETKSMILLK
ncbi:MAG: T9SS type A sorting domain-containing protein [Ignavibacteria bacterium]|nr:T9SS type A sorting domain-containing protein [Ignavibacteria bacterium]